MRTLLRPGVAIGLCVSLFTPLIAAAPADARSVRLRITLAPVTRPVRVQVKEPARVRPSTPPVSAIRPKVVQGVRPATGRWVAGPPMLRASELNGAIRAANARMRSLQSTFSAPGVPAPVGAARRGAAPRLPGAAGQPSAQPGARQTQSLPSNPSGSGTGINHWWRYQEENVPGGGHLMVNVGTGNLLLQDDDMSIAHKGIALAFRRTYNSQSLHNVNGGDSGHPGMYGNGWTNTFDAHIVKTAVGYYSLYDIDGARYDYHTLGFVAGQAQTLISDTVGNHNALVYDGSCGMAWTKKSGTVYYFYAPRPSTTCPAIGLVGGYGGRLFQIVGRNNNTSLSFTYRWDGNASDNDKVNQITAQTESGMATTLSFADVSGYRLLQQITFPDGTTNVSYGYDANGNLTTVSRPPNNASGIRPTQAFGYQALGSDFVMSVAASPRAIASCAANGCINDGGVLWFGYSGTGALNSTVSTIQSQAVVNPTISDGFSSGPLQGSGYSALSFVYDIEYYTSGVTTPTYRDTAGHMTNWVFDGNGRPTQTQACTASVSQGQQCIGTWLVSNETWDANDNLVSEIDPRGYETDYAYDANGNTVAEAAPSTTTSAGTFRPTKLYDYDGYNNVIAYCDEKASHANNGQGDWSSAGPPSSGAPDSLCATNGATAHAVFTFTPTGAEPFGELTNIRSPLGYNRAIGYIQQPGLDFGLPISVRGDAIAQSDGTRTPFQTMTYDGAGNVVCASSDGSDATTTTVLVYDTLNRLVARGDPDDASVTSPYCTKTPGIGGSAIATRTTYFPDGQVATTQTPAEAAANVSTQLQYDLDGDVTSEQRHFTTTAGPTRKWYDGADRLVEVQQPTDPNYDFYTFPWTTRYLYDLTQGGTVTVGSSAAYSAYGGLFKTQELLPSGVSTPQWNESGTSTGTANQSWQDTAGTSFDALDRAVTAYRNTGSGLMPVTNTYDAAGNAGMLSQKCNANGECQTFAYDPRGAKSRTTFNVTSSSTQSFTYDEDGHMALASNGIGAFVDSYDADGRKMNRQETIGAIVAIINYAYYLDGQRQSASISTTAQNLPSALTYTYRPDGQIRQLGVASACTFSFAYTGGRRLTSRSDTTGQAADTFGYTTNTSPTSYGLAQTMAAPGFYETGMTYSAEAGQLGGGIFSWNGSGFFPSHTIGVVYTTRGELVVDTSGLPNPVRASLYANGMRIQTASSGGNTKTAAFAFNALQSMPVGTNSADTCAAGCLRNDSTWDYGYDAGGRQVAAVNTSNFNNGSDAPAYFQYTNTKSYDAEDHLLVQSLPYILQGKSAYQQALGYQWGPLGHPLHIGSTSATPWLNSPPADFQYDSLIWDDDDLLVTVNSVGQIDDLKVADFADYVPGASNPLTVWDRDVNGQLYGCHTGSGAAAIASSGFQQSILFCNGSSFQGPQAGFSKTPVGRGGMLLVQKSDGFSDGQNTFQGVRTYDPQAGTWTTPDAYHGDVHDPMSQKPYMWNKNNPYQYSDPTGYCVGPLIIWCLEIGGATLALLAEAGAPGSSAALGAGGRTLVIGKLADLEAPGAVGAGERALGMINKGTAASNWKQNSGFIRAIMREGKPIRDASVKEDGSLADNTGFLRAERELLINGGWRYDRASRFWKPPSPMPAAAPPPTAPQANEPH